MPFPVSELCRIESADQGDAQRSGSAVAAQRTVRCHRVLGSTPRTQALMIMPARRKPRADGTPLHVR